MSLGILLSIAVTAILVENYILVKFFGICPFLGVSKKRDTALGMGMAVTFVMAMSSVLTWLINTQILIPFDLGYLRTITYILVIAALVQFVEMALQKLLPALYQALGIYLPLITTNCAVLASSILVADRQFGLFEGFLYGLLSGVGFMLVIYLFASVRERLQFADIPKSFEGFPIAMISAGLFALAFMGFSGLTLPFDAPARAVTEAAPSISEDFNFLSVAYAVIALGVLGLLFGFLLGIAARFFHVNKDERIEAVTAALPGANCGGCGYSGCAAYADAIVNIAGTPINRCAPGGAATADAIASIMGVEAVPVVEGRAFVRCAGGNNARRKYTYSGIKDCHAAARLDGGELMCSYGCLGYGSCVAVCRFGALSLKDGVAVVDPEKCTACSTCVATCPKGLITIVPRKAPYAVTCSSKDSGPVSRQNCDSSCIACKICEKNCKFDAIKVIESRAIIDYDKCTACGVCVEKCPRKIIHIIKMEKPTVDYKPDEPEQQMVETK